MPIREYIACDPARGCAHCRKGFERIESIDEEPVAACPQCGRKIHRRISAPRVGRSQSGLDDRARQAGFHKLKRTGKGEYEKED